MKRTLAALGTITCLFVHAGKAMASDMDLFNPANPLNPIGVLNPMSPMNPMSPTSPLRMNDRPSSSSPSIKIRINGTGETIKASELFSGNVRFCLIDPAEKTKICAPTFDELLEKELVRRRAREEEERKKEIEETKRTAPYRRMLLFPVVGVALWAIRRAYLRRNDHT